MARKESEAQRQARLARRRAYARAWRERNRERLRKYYREYHPAWRARNRDKVRETNARMYQQRTRLAAPQSLAQAAAALRWDGLQRELQAEARREFVADCLEADFAMLAIAWFECRSGRA
ncbi:MAG TPA: hypothetical protein VF200_06785 [Woeseiaceae bacterium]